MAGSIERRLRDIAWSLLRELPNVSLFNGKGRWSMPPRFRKHRLKIPKLNTPVLCAVGRGPPRNRGFYSIVFVLVLIFSVSLLAAATFTVTGQYLDKKGNPMAGAQAVYLSGGTGLDSTHTDGTGHFSLSVQTTGLDPAYMPGTFYLGNAYPNPFNSQVRIPVQTSLSARFVLYNIRGQLISHIHVPPGRHEITWGGQDLQGKAVSAGVYLITPEGSKMTRRMVLLDGRNSRGGLAFETLQPQPVLSKVSGTDLIRFTRSNSSPKTLEIIQPSGDTTLGVIRGNTGPVLLDSLPNLVGLPGCSLQISLMDYFYDDDPGITFELDPMPAGNALHIAATYLLFTVPEDSDTIHARIQATDESDPGLIQYSNAFKAYPVLGTPVQTREIGEQLIYKGDSLGLYMPDYVTHSRGDSLTYALKSGTGLRFMQAGDCVYLWADSTFTGHIDGIILTASDGDNTLDLNPFSLHVKELNNVTFIIKDYYTDSTLTTDTTTFWINEQEHKRIGGELTLKLKDGTYEFNATNPNTADGINDLAAPFYTFLRRPSDTENFEQRDKIDYTSPITISKNDTIIAYKLMIDGPFLQGLGLYVDPYGIGTKRFSASLDSVPCWWNTNYMTPDSLRRLYTHEILNLIKEIPHIGKVNFYYLESNEQPPIFWELAMDPSFASPGTNSTDWNEQGEIMRARARGPPQTFSRQAVYIESLQAIAKLYDSGGTDPPILGPNEDDTKLIINELGKKLLSFIYFVWPNTRI